MQNNIHQIVDQLIEDVLENPMVYKFHEINQLAFELLVNSEINFKNPYAFDFHLTLETNDKAAQISHFFEAVNSNKLAVNDHEIQRLIATDFADSKALKRKIDSLSKQVIEKIGYSSFYQNKENFLMWSHLAHGHKGLCLEFDTTLDARFFQPTKMVSYNKNYPVYNAKNSNVVELLMLQKLEHWSHQKEIRIIKKEAGSFHFDPTALTKIYFGLNASAQNIKTIKNLISDTKKYKHVKLFQAFLDGSHYKLKFVPLV